MPYTYTFLNVENPTDYIRNGTKTAMLAGGCFWCMEEAFEHYVPGVVEAISGYSGGRNSMPTYSNHPGHIEVILVVYDPLLTSYEVILQYLWRNIDPFDSAGQFCDKGHSYLPAIYYGTELERKQAEASLMSLEIANPAKFEDKITVPILEAKMFWEAELYHQNYMYQVFYLYHP